MKVKPSIEIQDFRLTRRLAGAGWFEARIAIAGTDYDFTISYLSEPLRDLLSTILDLHMYYDGRYDTDEPKFYLVWQGEPWRYEWLFEALPDEVLRVTLTFCDGDTPERGAADEVRFVAHFSFRELARQTYQQARAILRNYGFLGYRDEWIATDFPISDFLRLHYVLAGEPPHRDSLAAELVLLTELLNERKA
ncbi:MAG: hypothetical protein K8S22_06065 [Betaproteobacteria bacterium]|nr:hypothetical protein [Betaproteobacteria bacterium]